MRKFGYARVSTHKQSLDIQIQKLIEHGVEEHRICTDKQSGKNTDRPGLQELLIKVEKGDQVLVCKLDRLGRDNLDMLNLIAEFDKKNVTVRFLDDGISTDGPMGKMTIQILSAVAEAERNRILERSREGIAAAVEKGIKLGRKPSLPEDKIIEMLNQGIRPTDIAKQLNISRGSIYLIMKRNK